MESFKSSSFSSRVLFALEGGLSSSFLASGREIGLAGVNFPGRLGDAARPREREQLSRRHLSKFDTIFSMYAVSASTQPTADWGREESSRCVIKCFIQSKSLSTSASNAATRERISALGKSAICSCVI